MPPSSASSQTRIGWVVNKIRNCLQGLRSPCAQSVGGDGAETEDDRPRQGKDLLTMQPHPLQWLVARFKGITGVARFWTPGATRRCRLCQECRAVNVSGFGFCLLMFEGNIPTESAALISDRGIVTAIRDTRLPMD